MRSPSHLFRALREFQSDFEQALGRRGPLIRFAIASLAVAFLELASVAVFAPLLSVLMGGQSQIAGHAISVQSNGLRGLAWLSAAIVLIYALKGICNFVFQAKMASYCENKKTDLMRQLIESYLWRDYAFHLDKNSSTLFSNAVMLSNEFSGLMMAVLKLFSDALVIFCLIAFLMFQDALAISVLVVLMLGVSVISHHYLRPLIIDTAKRFARFNSAVWTQSIQAVSAVKEVKILGKEAYFVNKIAELQPELVRASAMNTALNGVPKIVIETMTILFVVCLIWIVVFSGSDKSMVTTLGLLGIAALRLMPASTSALASVNTIRGYRARLGELVSQLRDVQRAKKESSELQAAQDQLPQKTPFSSLKIEQLSYHYATAGNSESKPVLSEISLQIDAGMILGVMGKSGAGKSTLADLILGLLRPTAGRLLCNGEDIQRDIRAWRTRVAYIPQNILIIDDTLRQNIALGVPEKEINPERLQLALQQGQLSELLQNLPEGLDTQLGERGVKLSGGQRQRVAIARALYHDRDILVMDEATSALDEETEREVIHAIGALEGKKTVIVIAHKAAILRQAHRIITIENQGIREGVPTYVEAHSAMLANG